STPSLSTPSLHDALPIFGEGVQVLDDTLIPVTTDDGGGIEGAPSDGSTQPPEHGLLLDREQVVAPRERRPKRSLPGGQVTRALRSEEHTSELQSRENLVC